ncbi:MAG: histidinol-phosphatase, partial [Deltaproteobacteria bacterium]|nr:histidinol-phosphatase [Deltaproteobacteria bacterium]
ADSYGVVVFKNGKFFKVGLLLNGARTFTFMDTPETLTPTYYRVELFGMTHVNPLHLPFYGMEVALTNPIYINFPQQ